MADQILDQQRFICQLTNCFDFKMPEMVENLAKILLSYILFVIFCLKRIRFGFICVHQRVRRDELCQRVDVVGVLPVSRKK